MNEYREQLERKLEELRQEFEELKSNVVKDLENATPNRMSGMTSTYSSGISEMSVIAGKINALQEQIRAFEHYKSEEERVKVWCIFKTTFSDDLEHITEYESKEEALKAANEGKEEALNDDNVIRYMVALLGKDGNDYKRDGKAVRFYEKIDVLEEK